jgi:CheY-like chemotaxis protein
MKESIDIYDFSEKTILIAEDVETSNQYFKAALSKTKSNLLWAKNGEEAIKLFENNTVDLILMDIHMPKMNGFDATRRIKEIDKTVPIIMQTAYILSGEEEMSFEAGCDEFIPKPIKFKNLLSLVNKYLA